MNREEKKQATVSRIVNAALGLFSKKGYEETSVSEIAEAAGIAKGTFFNYFPSKEDVLIKFQKALFFNEINSLNDKSGPYTPRILTLVKEMGDSINENRALSRASLQRFLASSAVEASKYSIHSNVTSLIPLFEKGQQSGEFITSIPAAIMSRTAVQIYLGALLSWSTGADEESLGEQLLLSFQVFFNGVGKK